MPAYTHKRFAALYLLSVRITKVYHPAWPKLTNINKAWRRWRRPLILALRRQKQVNLLSSRTAKATQKKTRLKKIFLKHQLIVCKVTERAES